MFSGISRAEKINIKINNRW